MISIAGPAPFILSLPMCPMDIFDEIKAARGSVANIHAAFAEFPAGVACHFDFHSSLLSADGLPLSREERELLAVAASRANACEYTLARHEAALQRAQAETTTPSAAASSDSSSSSSSSSSSASPAAAAAEPLHPAKAALLADFAHALTLEPASSHQYLARFEAAGYSRAQFQHATMLVSYFAFAARCAAAMDVAPDADDAATQDPVVVAATDADAHDQLDGHDDDDEHDDEDAISTTTTTTTLSTSPSSSPKDPPAIL